MSLRLFQSQRPPAAPKMPHRAMTGPGKLIIADHSQRPPPETAAAPAAPQRPSLSSTDSTLSKVPMASPTFPIAGKYTKSKYRLKKSPASAGPGSEHLKWSGGYFPLSHAAPQRQPEQSP